MNNTDIWAGGPKGAARVLQILTLLSKPHKSMTLTEISSELGGAKSTFTDTLKVLGRAGYLISENGSYTLGPAAFRLAGSIMQCWSMPDVVRYYVRDLGQKTRESIGYAIADWEIGQAIYADAVNSTRRVHYAMRTGLRVPLYASAVGRVLLAYSPPERTQAYLEKAHLKALTSRTRISPDTIMEQLETIREQGYCASFGEMLKDTAAIAVPVFDPTDKLVGGIILAAPLDRMRANFDPILSHVIQAGHGASGKLGNTGTSVKAAE